MTLTSRFVQKKTVPLWEADGEEQSLTVRGLSPADISELLPQEEGALGELYLAFTNLAGDPLDLSTHLARLIDTMPALAARIIAQAADIPEEWEDVQAVPVGPQTELLDAITKLTFKSDESAKKSVGGRQGIRPDGSGQKPPERIQDWHWGLRKQVSLLLDHGHPEAASYPIGMLSDEARMVEERTAAEQGMLATLAQMAVSTVPNMGVKPTTTKRAMRLFQNAIKMLTGRDNGQG